MHDDDCHEVGTDKHDYWLTFSMVRKILSESNISVSTQLGHFLDEHVKGCVFLKNLTEILVSLYKVQLYGATAVKLCSNTKN